MLQYNTEQAVKYCLDNNFQRKYWDCGYTLEVLLEDVGIKHIGEWTELEDQLYYKA